MDDDRLYRIYQGSKHSDDRAWRARVLHHFPNGRPGALSTRPAGKKDNDRAVVDTEFSTPSQDKWFLGL